MRKEMKKLTVGDMSGCNRAGEKCAVIRSSLADIDEGGAGATVLNLK